MVVEPGGGRLRYLMNYSRRQCYLKWMQEFEYGVGRQKMFHYFWVICYFE